MYSIGLMELLLGAVDRAVTDVDVLEQRVKTGLSRFRDNRMGIMWAL